VSLRERPMLPVVASAMKAQAYFSHLEFELFDVRALEAVEMIAEKVRAAFQRVKVRDLYDLHRFATIPFNGELLRRLAVLKLWQARDPFDPEALFEKIRGGDYDWADIQRLVRSSERIEPVDIIKTVESRFDILRALTELEQEVIADAKSGWNEPLADRLRAEIRGLAAG
jgi:hypothetical protein